MLDLTVIILTRNEERNITACIESVKGFASKIIVIDGESTDSTPKLAAALGAEVKLLDAWQGWGKRRQQAQGFAATRWIMHLDADERLTPELRSAIEAVLKDADDKTVLALPRANHFLGRRVRHCGWSPDYVLRVYANAHTHYDDAMVHEKLLLPPDTRVVKLKAPLTHYTCVSFDKWLNKQREYALNYAHDRAARGKNCSLAAIPFKALFAFLRLYVFRAGFLDGKTGFLLSLSAASYELNKYLALYLERNFKDRD